MSLGRQNIVITHWACFSVLMTFYILGSDSARAAAGLAAAEQALLSMVGNGIVISAGSSTYAWNSQPFFCCSTTLTRPPR